MSIKWAFNKIRKRSYFISDNHCQPPLPTIADSHQTSISCKMTTLPTSLRRTLLVLLIAMTTIVMVFYWNQSALKPVTFMNGVFTKVEQNKLVRAVNYTT